MKGEELATVVSKVMEGVMSTLRQELTDHVRGAVEQYRRGVWVRDEWCCAAMVQFATHFFLAPRPKNGDGMFHTAFTIRGEAMNYCPFCGAWCGETKRTKDQ